MRVLVLGGTKFVGRAVVEELSKRGHSITVFCRGQSNPNAFGTLENVEKIYGNRDGELSKLGDGSWDVCIDTCGYVPRLVRDSVQYLKDKVSFYAFVSTVSVYPEFTPAGPEVVIDEDSKLATLVDPTIEAITGETYGGLKVLCEQEVEKGFPLDTNGLIVRPGLIIGPHDLTNRFPYYVRRAAEGGRMLVPPKEMHHQLVDVRDLAHFILVSVENRATGVYNVVGDVASWEQVMHSVKDGADVKDVEFVWPSKEFVTAQGDAMYARWPAWADFATVSNARAKGAGLQLRPLLKTVRDTYTWLNTMDNDERGRLTPNVGMTRADEDELLRLWQEA